MYRTISSTESACSLCDDAFRKNGVPQARVLDVVVDDAVQKDADGNITDSRTIRTLVSTGEKVALIRFYPNCLWARCPKNVLAL